MSRQLSAIVNGFRDRVAQVWPRLPGPLQTPQKSSGCLRASRAAPTLSIGYGAPRSTPRVLAPATPPRRARGFLLGEAANVLIETLVAGRWVFLQTGLPPLCQGFFLRRKVWAPKGEAREQKRPRSD